MLKLVQTAFGVFDLAFDDPANADADAAAATVVYAALFTDARAPEKRVADKFDRRGWHEDQAAGSGLWYVRRQPLGSAARREALSMVKAAIAAHGITDVDVTETTGSAGSVSSVFMQISGTHNGRKFSMSVPL